MRLPSGKDTGRLRPGTSARCRGAATFWFAGLVSRRMVWQGTGENHLAVVVLGTFQSSLRDFSVLVAQTQDCRPGLHSTRAVQIS